nr:DUF2997 domain-containing protein [Anaerolineae bacterium]
MPYTITVTIDEEGNASFEVKGIKGPGCEKVLKPFEKLGPVVKERKTPEYYQAE